MFHFGYADPRLVLKLYAHASHNADRAAAETTATMIWNHNTTPTETPEPVRTPIWSRSHHSEQQTL